MNKSTGAFLMIDVFSITLTIFLGLLCLFVLFFFVSVDTNDLTSYIPFTSFSIYNTYIWIFKKKKKMISLCNMYLHNNNI